MDLPLFHYWGKIRITGRVILFFGIRRVFGVSNASKEPNLLNGKLDETAEAALKPLKKRAAYFRSPPAINADISRIISSICPSMSTMLLK